MDALDRPRLTRDRNRFSGGGGRHGRDGVTTDPWQRARGPRVNRRTDNQIQAGFAAVGKTGERHRDGLAPAAKEVDLRCRDERTPSGRDLRRRRRASRRTRPRDAPRRLRPAPASADTPKVIEATAHARATTWAPRPSPDSEDDGSPVLSVRFDGDAEEPGGRVWRQSHALRWRRSPHFSPRTSALTCGLYLFGSLAVAAFQPEEATSTYSPCSVRTFKEAVLPALESLHAGFVTNHPWVASVRSGPTSATRYFTRSPKNENR